MQTHSWPLVTHYGETCPCSLGIFYFARKELCGKLSPNLLQVKHPPREWLRTDMNGGNCSLLLLTSYRWGNISTKKVIPKMIKHKLIAYYELSYIIVSWKIRIKADTHPALFFPLSITQIVLWLMMSFTSLTLPWLSCASKGRSGAENSKESQVKEKSYRAGSDALHDKYVMLSMSTPQNKWEKQLGKLEEVKQQHSHLLQLKGFFVRTHFGKKTTTNQTPETQTKAGKNPANSYTLTHSSFVAEVKKRKKLFTRWHIAVWFYARLGPSMNSFQRSFMFVKGSARTEN